MTTIIFFDTPVFQWVLLPLLIFIARVCDVSLDTIRIMLLSKEKKLLAPVLGFIQVTIWLLAIRQIILHISNIACYLAYAGGFAAGTFVGMYIENKLAIGFQVIRVITRHDARQLISALKGKGYGVTAVRGQGATGRVHLIFTIVKRSEIPSIITIIKNFNPKAFYTIEDVKSISKEGFLSARDLYLRRKQLHT
ncbi:MAG: DUF2179 domain-containing protein [Candidatus Omnitrophica bacterium]|nr:DUF2179 domain-containing protein [Candidatus Omnitrophota bacterium]